MGNGEKADLKGKGFDSKSVVGRNGFLFGIMFMAVTGPVLWYSLPNTMTSGLTDTVGKLVFALRFQTFQAFMIFFAIGQVGRIRGSTSAIDPLDKSNTKVQRMLEVPKNNLQNTIEQFLLSFVCQMVLSTYLEPYQLKLLPILAFWFVVGRLIFYYGYASSNPMNRSYGLGMTFLPNIAMFFYIFYLFSVQTYQFLSASSK